jgi:hypothetical protein
MGNWREEIQHIIREQDLQRAETVRRHAEEQERSRQLTISTEEARKRLLADRKREIENRLKELRVEEVLKKYKSEVWDGNGVLAKMEAGYRLAFEFHTGHEAEGWTVVGGQGDSESFTYWQPLLGIFFTEISLLETGVRVSDGSIEIPEPADDDYKLRWRPFIKNGGDLFYSSYKHSLKDIQTLDIPQVTGLQLEETLFRIGIDRANSGRLPQQLSRG